MFTPSMNGMHPLKAMFMGMLPDVSMGRYKPDAKPSQQQAAPDSDALFEAEYAADPLLARMGITEADYVSSRHRDANNGQAVMQQATAPGATESEPAPFAVGSKFCMSGEAP